MPGISQDVLDQKTGNEGKTVFFSPAGDDNFPGTTNPQAVATLAQADTLANALNPTTADPVAIVSLARAVYAESISLNDNISINAVTINLNNDGASPVVSIGTNTRCFLDAIVNNAGPAFEIPGEVATTTTVNAISAATIGIDHNQLSGNNEVSSIFIIAGQRCVSNTSTSTLRGLKVNCDEILIGGNNGVGLYQDSTSVMDVDVDYINGSGVSGAIGIDGQSGEIFVYAKEIECDAAVNVESGATVNLLVQKLGSSDINVEAGGILNIWCTDDNYSGNITNNGTINGFISNTYYGNADTGTVDSVTGGTNIDVDNTDPKNPIVNLPSNITGQQVNSVTLTAGGSASDYLDATGSYSTPPAGGQVDSVNSGTNVSVDNTDPVNPVINLPSNLAGQDVNSVTLTAGGSVNDSLRADGTYQAVSTGDVVGPGSAVDDNFASFDGATGKLIQDSGFGFLSLPDDDFANDATFRSTSNVGGWDVAQSYTTKVLQANQSYKVTTYFVWNHSSTFNDALYRQMVDIGGGLVQQGEIFRVEPKDTSGNIRIHNAIQSVVTIGGSDTAITVELQFRVGGFATNECWNSYIFVEKLVV